MGSVFKKTFTRPLPEGAKITARKGKRIAEWIDAKGKRRAAPLTGDGDRISVESKTYTAKYRDGSGIVREVATGCRDESAARSILGKLERRAELVKGEIISASEDGMLDHQSTPLADHVAAFVGHQKAKGVTAQQIADTRSRLERVAKDCNFSRLGDLSGNALEKWLANRQAEGMGARCRNAYRESWMTLGNWCVRNRRLLNNPFSGVSKADEKADCRRKRRSLTEAELTRLLDVARRRPLLDRMTVHRGKRKGEVYAKLRPEVQTRLERLGRERALIYKTLALTGLRKSELASITAGQCVLDAVPAYLVLKAADEKNREGSTIPLRADLADDLRQWLADKATAALDAAREASTVSFDSKHLSGRKRITSDSTGCEGQSCQTLTTVPTLPPDTPLFTVPKGLVRILDRDLLLAGIPKVDERGRTIDVHALRHTFGTLLSAAGVAPRTAQAAMRHSSIDLTMNVYTDPKLLDVAGAMEALPSLSLSAIPNVAKATGTDDFLLAPNLAPNLAPTLGKSATRLSIPDKQASWEGTSLKGHLPRKTPVKQGFLAVEPKGIEPSTSWMQTRRSPN